MAMEIELKLTLAKDHLEMLKQHPLLTGELVAAQSPRALQNIYFDTPNHLLSEHRIALRVRCQQGKFIQTLKTQGTSEAGLHSRDEWEWEVPTADVDLSLIDTACWPASLDIDDLLSEIQPVFSTDFVRQIWWYQNIQADGAPVQIEIALDTGTAWTEVAGQRVTDDICEVELELKEGEPEALFTVACQLAQRVPMLSADTSKAERGYRLHSQSMRLPARVASTVTEQDTYEDVYCKLLQQELVLWPRYLEAWKVTKDWQYASQALEAIRNIGALFQAFQNVITQDVETDIDPMLTKLIRQMRDLDSFERTQSLLVGATQHWHSQAHEQSAARLSVLLQTVEPGLLTLRIAEHLVSKAWRKSWSEQQAKRGLAPFNQRG